MAFMELSARLGLDGSAFRAGLDKAKAGVASLRSSIGSGIGSQVGGLLGVASIVAYAKSTIDLGGKISDTSARLGISAEELQQWTFAATQNGASVEDLTGFFEKLAISKKKAVAGDKDAIASFKALGVSMDVLNKKKVADIALQVGKTMQTGNVEELSPTLKTVGGKGSGNLIATFLSDFETLMASAPVMNNAAVASLDEVGDALDKMALQLRGPMADALKNIIPLFQTVIDGFNGISALMKDAVGGASAEGFGKIFKEFSSALIHFRLPKVAAEFDKMSSGGTKNFEAFGKSIRDREIAAADAKLAEEALAKAKAAATPPPEVVNPKPIKLEPLAPLSPTIRDSLSQIGGFTMAQNREVLDVQREQVSLLEKIVDNTDKIEAPATVDDGLD
jgi:hypothetical protein